jgi:alkylation response protein AidB-like acyl-CoA dehydrogenase
MCRVRAYFSSIASSDQPTLDSILPHLRTSAQACDQTGEWPAQDWAELCAAGANRWVLPRDFGGDELSPLELHLKYERIASASLAAALVLTQRDAAVDLIAGSPREPPAGGPLAALLTGADYVTVGIAQLTTSRQGGPPALRATPVESGASAEGPTYRVDGVIPWCTGAAKAAAIVAGAVTPAGAQVLFTLPVPNAGLTVEPPMQLAAFRASWTSQLRCDGVLIQPEQVLRGPAANVLSPRRTHLLLGQAFLALGLCRAGIDLIGDHASAPASRAAEQFERQLAAVRGEVIDLSQPDRTADATAAAPAIRGRCNDLAIRITHAGVALYKGTGLLPDHPAQRLARESMFLLVWSCPTPVTDCTVDLLADG